MFLIILEVEEKKFDRILVVRPAVTVRGEDLGFLPGDVDDKMKPFMLPIMQTMTQP